MCRICDARAGISRRGVLAGSVTAAAAGASGLFMPGAARAQTADAPAETGAPGRRILIRGGHVMSMDDEVGDLEGGDVLIEGSEIVEIGHDIEADDAEVIDASGRIVMPGFIDTHHHQFQTALRGFLADGILFDDGTPEGSRNYLDYILGRFSGVYRPEDVRINELFGSLSQLDAGVTTVLDVSQIHNSPEHSDAAIEGLAAARRRSVFGYFEGQGEGAEYPQDARRIREQHFPGDDDLMTMIMGGEIYLPDGHEAAWELGRELDLKIAYHVVGALGMAEPFEALATSGAVTSDHILIHMTGMTDAAWEGVRDAGAHVSLAVPIEMQMRHGTPPLLKMQEMGMAPSLSTDVECTMTADFFTQMRATLTLQRMFVNEMALDGVEERPRMLTARDVLRYATIEGARGLGLEGRTGSLAPGKQADILILDAEAINVAPLNNVPGAVVTLMERNNVETVLVAGEIRKWQGVMQDVDLGALRGELTASRDHLFEAAGIDRALFEG